MLAFWNSRRFALNFISRTLVLVITCLGISPSFAQTATPLPSNLEFPYSFSKSVYTTSATIQLDGTITLFGPQRFVRGKGKPVTETRNFSLPKNAHPPFLLHMTTGDEDRATIATIQLNDQMIFSGTIHDHPKIPQVFTVDLKENNSLAVRLLGKPDSYISIWITGAKPTDQTAPVITITSPLQGAVIGAKEVNIVGTVDDQSSTTVTVNGVAATVKNNQTLTAVVPLPSEGQNNLTAIATDAARNTSTTSLTVIRDTTSPLLTVNAPVDGSIIAQQSVNVSGRVSDLTSVSLTVNGASIPVDGSDNFSGTVPLSEGVNHLVIGATDAAGNNSTTSLTVICDTTPPLLTVNAPVDGSIVAQQSVNVSGTVSDLTPVSLTVNGASIPVDGSGNFSGSVSVVEGVNNLAIAATDAAGNNSSTSRTVTSDTLPPVLTVTSPLDGETVSTSTINVSGTVQDATTVNVSANGTSLNVVNGAFSGDVPLTVGPNAITVLASDVVGNMTTETRNVTRSGGNGLPPDPSTIAPPIDRTVSTTVWESTAFLHTGSNPIQTGVTPGTIEPVRAAVIRGRVMTRDNTPLSGVTITILSHPEFGQTLSRADGMFDLAVNGGGQLTVNYAKSDYLSIQRQVEVPWQDYAWAPDVVMISVDPNVSVIDLTSNQMQVARGSVISDSDGTRQATLLFLVGTQALMTLPNASTQTLSTLHVRMTEYTVSQTGPEAMPAELPPSSGYTYATEFSVDEATSIGATKVEFSQPVLSYFENFLSFPVGMVVPSGYYNRVKGQWIAEPNGRVVKIISVTNGLADLDTDGDSQVDNGVATTPSMELTISTDERQILGALYTAGQTLWRVPVTHFSPRDHNWPFGPPPGAQPPNLPSPQPLTTNDPCDQAGSIIGCENQTLGEVIPIQGTPIYMRYASNRIRGRTDRYKLQIPVSGSSLPTEVKRIDVVVEVAGRKFMQSFSTTLNQSFSFTWDGRDAYGRTVQGSQPVIVHIGYVYQADYYPPAPGGSAGQSFGLYTYSSTPVTDDINRVEVTLWQDWHGIFSTWDTRGENLGGWNLSVHHVYDPTGHILYRGDGKQVNARDIKTMERVVGNGTYGPSGDNGPATAAQLNGPSGVAIAPDGSLYITDYGNWRVRRVGMDGIITTVAGNGTLGFSGDGGLARLAQLGDLQRGIAIAPDGSLYIADSGNYRVRRVDTNGIITTVAGNGLFCSYLYDPVVVCGDGGPATQARTLPWDIALGPDGSLYIADAGSRVRRVSPDGIITTVAGVSQLCDRQHDPTLTCGDGGPATQAQLEPHVLSIAVAADGTIYVGESFDVRRIGPDGIITTVAGAGPGHYNGDGIPAKEAIISPEGLEVGADGSLYIAEGNRVRRVGPDGIITTVAGKGADSYSLNHICGNGEPATQFALGNASDVALGKDGSLYAVDESNNVVCRVTPVLPGYSFSDIVLASEDGSEYYRFDANGRHLETLDAMTGALRYQFGYDSAGYLITVTDGYGNVTTIERDSSGNPTAIVASGGQRTPLTLDANGYLAGITNPAGESVQFTSTLDGLLTSLTDPMGNVHQFTYDSLGRLIRDSDPVGGVTTLTRTDFASGFTIQTTTALNRTTTYKNESLPTGAQRMTTIDSEGAQTQVIIDTDGSQTGTYPDGSVIKEVPAPDPRWGMQAPLLGTLTYTSPLGSVMSVSSQRTVTLMDPNNPLSLQSIDATVNVNGRTSTAHYDAVSRTVTNTSTAGRQSFATLDEHGRIASIQPATDVSPTNFTYDDRGRLIQVQQESQFWIYTYDAQNRVTTRTDASGNQFLYGYDATDRVTSVTIPGGQVYRFTYDANGNRNQVIMPNDSNYELGYTAIDLGASFTPPGGASLTRMYDPDREMTQMTLPSGRTLSYSYDNGGRPAAVTDTNTIAGFNYNDSTQRVGHITLSSIGGQILQDVALSYDGSAPTSIVWDGVAQGTFNYEYDPNRFLTHMSLTSGTDVINTILTRDGDGLLIGYGPFTFTRSGPGGALSQISDSTLLVNYDYDTLARVINRSHTVSGQDMYSVQIVYDNVGRIAQKTETVDGTTSVYTYNYDANSQLIQIHRDGILVEVYAYDANGNRISRELAGNPIETATYDSQDRLVQQGNVIYQYDADGFLTQRGSDTFEYSPRGELLRASAGGVIITYAYDGLGRRVGRTDASGTTQYLYGDPGNPFKVTVIRNPNGILSIFYYDENDSLIAFEQDGSRYYVATDQQGTPLVISDSSGAVVKVMAYDSFGDQISDSSPSFDFPIGFAGGLNDPVTGLVHFGFRDYDPNAGRWTARDPALYGGGQGNLYVYVQNNPVNLRDPFGLFCVGFSFYSGVGTGAKFCYQDGKVSVCEEFGFGFGGGLEFGGGLASPGNDIIGKLSASCGPLALSAGFKFDHCGNFEFEKPTFDESLGPLNLSTDSGGNTEISAGFEAEGGKELKGFTDAEGEGGCKLTGKIAGQFCQQFGH